MSTDALLELAVNAAHAAGELLLGRFGGPQSGVDAKSSATDMVSDADRDAERLLLDAVSSARPADGVIADELDANTGERRDELHERVDVAADHVLARLHTLDRRHGQARQLGELSLVDTQEGTRRPQLS